MIKHQNSEKYSNSGPQKETGKRKDVFSCVSRVVPKEMRVSLINVCEKVSYLMQKNRGKRDQRKVKGRKCRYTVLRL